MKINLGELPKFVDDAVRQSQSLSKLFHSKVLFSDILVSISFISVQLFHPV